MTPLRPLSLALAPRARRWWPRPPRRAPLAAAALAVTLGVVASSGAVAAQGGAGGASAATPPQIPPLGEAATARLVHDYEQAGHWAMRGIVLMSLGTDWHPAATQILVAALEDRDDRLPPFAIETVLRCSERTIGAIATAPLVEALIDTLRVRNDYVRERTTLALQRLLPEAGCDDRRGFQRWWREHEEGWAPAPWSPAAVEVGEGTVTRRLVERAFDLRDAGLQVVFVVDSTGSMQRAIDAARDAIEDVSALLAGVTAKLELGLVHYKDFGDLGDGAELLVPLTRRHDKVRERLAKIVASGGGDAPERVEKGIEVALDRQTRWDKDANRMLLLVGDAPPHAEVRQQLLAMVRQAHDEPFATGRGPVTGRRQALRPFITSAIATNPGVLDEFRAIAAAGGGTAVGLDLPPVTLPRGRPGALPGELPGEPAAREDDGGLNRAAEQVAEHVLLLSFGAGYEAPLGAFVRVFFAYRRAGAFD